MFRHFVPTRGLHPLAPLMRLSPVYLPSANSIKCCSPPASFLLDSSTKKIESKEDLKDAVIGVQLGTTGDIYAGDVEDSTVERYKKGFEAVQALSQGKIDAVVIDSEPAKEFVADAEGLKILDEAFTEEDYALAVAKDNEELTKKLNEALANLKESGKLDEIIGKYISADAE